MVVAALLGAAIVGLVILYLTQPVYRPFRLSAARFFNEEPRSHESRLRISLASLLLSRPFYLQLLALLAMLAALVFAMRDHSILTPGQHIGLWVVVDTSGSMSVHHGGENRLDIARRDISDLMSRIDTFPAEVQICISVYTFDMELTRRALNVRPAEVNGVLAQVTPRPLGTDVSLLRQLLAPSDDEMQECAPTHMVIFSDLPAPEIAVNAPIPMIWRAVGRPATNVGLTSVRFAHGLLPGTGKGLDVEVASYGEQVQGAALMVTDATGTEVFKKLLDASASQAQQLAVPLPASGLYQLQIAPGGAYSYDDEATVNYDAGDVLHVDWEMGDATLPATLGWRTDTASPQLRVVPYPAAIASGVPTLLIGDAYQKSDAPGAIEFFVEGHPLIADLNFDVAESLRIAGLRQPLVEPLQPILFDNANNVWFAASSEPPAAYVPGLPSATGDANLDAFSATAFFNAVRFLLQVERPAVACRLTGPDQPEPSRDRCALHPGEGNTALFAVGAGSLDEIAPIAQDQTRRPLWPLLVAMALAVLVSERALGGFGGSRWR